VKDLDDPDAIRAFDLMGSFLLDRLVAPHLVFSLTETAGAWCAEGLVSRLLKRTPLWAKAERR
jgi:hypothetical protein